MVFRSVVFPLSSARASASYLSRNACHTSLVESNGATGPDVLSSLCYARGVISFFHREPPRETTGKKEHRQLGARFVSTVSDSRRHPRLESLMHFSRLASPRLGQTINSLSLSLPLSASLLSPLSSPPSSYFLAGILTRRKKIARLIPDERSPFFLFVLKE